MPEWKSISDCWNKEPTLSHKVLTIMPSCFAFNNIRFLNTCTRLHSTANGNRDFSIALLKPISPCSQCAARQFWLHVNLTSLPLAAAHPNAWPPSVSLNVSSPLAMRCSVARSSGTHSASKAPWLLILLQPSVAHDVLLPKKCTIYVATLIFSLSGRIFHAQHET